MSRIHRHYPLGAIVIAAALLAGACSREPPVEEASFPAGPRLFVTNEVGGDITVIDPMSASVIATIPVGTRPRGVALSPDGALLYVALSGTPIGGPGVDEDTLPPADRSADALPIFSFTTLTLDLSLAPFKGLQNWSWRKN
jgi:YVTN family beta-propeller protein